MRESERRRVGGKERVREEVREKKESEKLRKMEVGVKERGRKRKNEK